MKLLSNLMFLTTNTLSDLFSNIEDNFKVCAESEKRIKALEKTEEAMLFRIGEFRKQVDKLEEQGYLRTNDDGTVSYVTAKVTPAPEQPTQRELLNQMRDESYRHDILQSDPIELFKEDRQKRLTAIAIWLMGWLRIKTVQELTWYSKNDLIEEDYIGEKTVAYIEHCLRRHGLSLRESPMEKLVNPMMRDLANSIEQDMLENQKQSNSER